MLIMETRRQGHPPSNAKFSHPGCRCIKILTFTNVIGVVVPSMSKMIAFTPTKRDSASAADLFCGAIICVPLSAMSERLVNKEECGTNCLSGQVRAPLIGLERALPICLASRLSPFSRLLALPCRYTSMKTRSSFLVGMILLI